MIWHDIAVQRPLCDQEIARGLAAAFGISPIQIVVHRGADDFPEPGGARVVCVVSERHEGFRLVLAVYTYFDTAQHNSVPVAKEFARTIQTEILLSDDSPDPYTMTRIMPTGEVVRTNLDMDLLDERGEYHVRE